MRHIIPVILIGSAVLTSPARAQPSDNASPVNPPRITYPSSAAERGVTGTCNMLFDVDRSGKPYNITAECTNRVFSQASIRAISGMVYAPKVVNGQAVERLGMTYPIIFALD